MNRTAKNTIILGSGTFLVALLAEIRARPRCPYRVVGVVNNHRTGKDHFAGFPVLGTVEELHQIIAREDPKVIITGLTDISQGASDDQLLTARVCRDIRVEHAEEVYERLTGKLPIEAFPPGEIIYSDQFQPRRLTVAVSRLLSVAAATAGLILLAPLMLLIALLIKLDSSGPVFFVQERSGLAGRRFKLLKFRTMKEDDRCESEWEEDNVHRITALGRWLRRFRLDELPQFLNILRGDMNLVGPRPHPVSNFELLVLASRNAPESGIQIPFYTIRSNIRPGITGWAQVRYRYANNLNEEVEKLRFDLYYLKHYSVWLDLRIMFETVMIVFTGHRTDADEPKDQALNQPFSPVHLPTPAGPKAVAAGPKPKSAGPKSVAEPRRVLDQVSDHANI